MQTQTYTHTLEADMYIHTHPLHTDTYMYANPFIQMQTYAFLHTYNHLHTNVYTQTHTHYADKNNRHGNLHMDWSSNVVCLCAVQSWVVLLREEESVLRVCQSFYTVKDVSWTFLRNGHAWFELPSDSTDKTNSFSLMSEAILGRETFQKTCNLF